MYFEFLYIFIDYFTIINKKVLIFEWGLPLFAGLISVVLSYGFGINTQYAIIEKSFGYVGTLLGFTLAALTLLLSSDKMKGAKEYKIEKIIHNRQASLFDLVVISYTYLIVVEGLLCLSFFIAELFDFVYIEKIAIALNIIYIVLLFNVLLTTIRTITDMYFILIKQ